VSKRTLNTRSKTTVGVKTRTGPVQRAPVSASFDLYTAARNVVLMVLLTLTTATVIHLLFGNVALMMAMSLAVAYAIVVGGAVAGLLCALAVLGLLLGLHFYAGWDAIVHSARIQAALIEVLACVVVVLLAIAVELRRQLTERHEHARAELEGQAGLMQNVLDGMGKEMFIGLLETDGTILELNRSVSDISGLEPEVLIGRRFDRVPWWGDRSTGSKVGAALKRAAAGESSRFDVRVQAATRQIWIDLSIKPLRDAEGRVRFLVPSAMDISERRGAEGLQRAIFEAVPTAVILVDREGRVHRANEQIARILGHRPEDLVGKTFEFLLPPEIREHHPELIRSYFENPMPRMMGLGRELTAVHADGHRVPVEIGLNPLSAEHGDFVIAAISDITDRQKAQQTLRNFASQMEAEVQARTRELQQTNARWQLRNNQLLAMSEMLSRLHICRDEAEFAAVVADRLGGLQQHSAGAIYLELNGTFERAAQWGEHWQPPTELPEAAQLSIDGGVAQRDRLDQDWLRLYIPLFSENTVAGLLMYCLAKQNDDDAQSVIEDDTEFLLNSIGEPIGLALVNLRLRHALQDQAIRDALTGLHNRRFLDASGPKMIAAAVRQNHPVSVFMADIDRFKRVNDTWGHDVGDQVLRRVARLIADGLRSADIACRYGGEEFVALLTGSTHAQALECAERIRQKVAADVIPNVGQITISLGVATLGEHGEHLDALVMAADKAMYRAKHEGRNRVVSASFS
jgi:diguanylate cyclase (GGDEF)-like protein/PAS domain S-box-containing protein